MKCIFSILRETTKRFYKDNCPDRAAIISYYSLLAALPMLGVLLFLVTKFFSSEDLIFKTLHLFTKDFFTRLDPTFFDKTQYLAKVFSKMGLYGLIASLGLAFFLFSKIIQTINDIFKAPPTSKGNFWKNRFKEISLMVIAAFLFLSSFTMTNIIAALNRFIKSSPLGKYVNPTYIKILNNFLVKFFVPFFLTFLFFLIIYKYIPHCSISKRAAAMSALTASIIWEIAKSIFSWYLAKIALYGRLHGTLPAIVGFVLLVDLGFTILFWGAELDYVLNLRLKKRRNKG